MENAFGQPQSIIVLGGSSDIARAIVKKLCAARAQSVVLAGRNQTLLDEAAAEARDYGATTTHTVRFEATEPLDAARAVSACFEALGEPVDLVIVAVGLLGRQLEYEDDPTMAATMATVNYAWPVAALSELRRRLVAQGHGRILVLSSVAAIRVRRVSYLYSGAKAGLDRLCDGLADSLAGTGVTLQIVRPGFVRSKMTAGEPEIPFSTGVNEVADNVLRGLASESRVIWSPPILRVVFFVLRHLPAPIWRRVANR